MTAGSGEAAFVGSADPGRVGAAAKGSGGAVATKVTDDYGNTIATAYAMSLSTTGSGSISGKINYVGDVDLFSVVANGTGTMTVTITGASGKTGLVPKLTVEDPSSGTILVSSSAAAGSKTTVGSFNAAAGSRYYIQAAGVGSSTGNYTVKVSLALPPPPSVTPPSYLPGPTAYQAGDAVSVQVVDTSNGPVVVVLDTDLADSLTVSQSGSTVTVATATGSQSVSGTFVGIAAYGFGGDDMIRFDHSIAQGLVAVIYGGVGADAIYEAGLDASYFYGQEGNDMLVSVGGGADVLHGGTGRDAFWSDSSDLLVDTEATETAAKSIHQITGFAQPTTTPGQAVSLEIAGQDIVDPIASASLPYTNNFVSNPLWVDGPQYNDIHQGAAGDCYFLAGLSALADTDPGLLQQSIAALGDGTYAVRFYTNIGGPPAYYRVDAQLPTLGSSPVFAHLTPSGELWVALLEKAFAQFRRGENSYSSIDSGSMLEAYRAITAASYSTYLTANSTADALAQIMANALAAGNAVTTNSGSTTVSPIVARHAYNVHSVTYENGTWYVTVYNPWARDGANWDSDPSDGLLKLTASQFKSAFYLVDVCLT